MQIIMNKAAVDTNILLYCIDARYDAKRACASKLIDKNPLIFPQNLSEFINVLTNRWKYPKQNLKDIIFEILSNCELYNPSVEVYKSSFELIKKYDFQIFDAIIVASALESGCTKLYTEDMQNGLTVNNQLQLINPFL